MYAKVGIDLIFSEEQTGLPQKNSRYVSIIKVSVD